MGRIRLVFVADEIPATLQRLVEFLNEQMPTVEVLAVEIRQRINGGTGLSYSSITMSADSGRTRSRFRGVLSFAAVQAENTLLWNPDRADVRYAAV